jgi:hypothetical protein
MNAGRAIGIKKGEVALERLAGSGCGNSGKGAGRGEKSEGENTLHAPFDAPKGGVEEPTGPVGEEVKVRIHLGGHVREKDGRE